MPDTDRHEVDWYDLGRWDADQVANIDDLDPFTAYQLACWSLYHNVPVEEVVRRMVEHVDLNLDTFMSQTGGTRDDYSAWRRGWIDHVTQVLTEMVEDAAADAEHDGFREIARVTREMEDDPLGHMLPRAVHCDHVRGDSPSCETCGDRVPMSTRSLDDIPTLE